jgi:hypothetical protein
MNQPFRRRTLLGFGLISLAVVLVGIFIVWPQLNQSSPGDVVLRYRAALDRHDLASANSMLSSDSRPWPLGTPAEQLGGRCLNPQVAQSIGSDDLAMVTLECSGKRGSPIYSMIKENGAWAVHR